MQTEINIRNKKVLNTVSIGGVFSYLKLNNGFCFGAIFREEVMRMLFVNQYIILPNILTYNLNIINLFIASDCKTE